MKFYSTDKKSPMVDFEQAVMNGLAPHGGLYMPESIPQLDESFLKKGSLLSFQDVAFEVAKKFFASTIPDHRLLEIIQESYNFDVPVVKLDDRINVFELFHGPTCAFKDFAARFMARLFGFFAEKSQQKITILVATSGDTGGAVADGFLNVSGVNVVILYPSGKVSPLQEKQLTGMGGNIRALEVNGTFDDCQKMVKQAFLDSALREKIHFASANSINVARLLPQSFYYVYLSAQMSVEKSPVVVSVPSGNFGNLTAGLIAKRMGAPISKFIAATNRNDVFPAYLDSGHFESRPSVATISNAMDVGNPSNFDRILDLYENNVDSIREDIVGFSYSDEATRKAICEVKEKYQYIMDPHGAVGYLGLKDYLNQHPNSVGVFIETAHPGKFFEEVEKVTHESVALPENLSRYLSKEKKSVFMENEFSALKSYLLSEFA